MKTTLYCTHCQMNRHWKGYAAHVKDCIAAKMLKWDESSYSANYYKQVRATSRFKQPGDPVRRSQFKAWGWWLTRPDGPPLMLSEVTRT